MKFACYSFALGFLRLDQLRRERLLLGMTLLQFGNAPMVNHERDAGQRSSNTE